MGTRSWVSPLSWELHQTDIVAQLRTPGVVPWWREQRPSFSPEFVALVEEILGEERGRQRLQRLADVSVSRAVLSC
ncbi:MAG: hypothetical protein JRF61_14030 [Deltaproteobacteria bacterium]|nr:hypothetical protein [Deltaproteobacteria bacterium]